MQLSLIVKRWVLQILLFCACVSVHAAANVFTINSHGEQVTFAPENFTRPAVLPDESDFHLFGWSGKSSYRVTDFYGVAFVRANGAYAGDFLDWGTLQPVQPDEEPWRTLTAEEWTYLLNSRPNAAKLAGEAMIDNQKGLVLLPDTFTISVNQAVADWAAVSAKGAVFLPYQGYRDGVDIMQEGEVGYYWTATSNHSKKANYINIINLESVETDRYIGCSVRLVQPVCQHTIHLHVDDAAMGKVIIFKPQ